MCQQGTVKPHAQDVFFWRANQTNCEAENGCGDMEKTFQPIDYSPPVGKGAGAGAMPFVCDEDTQTDKPRSRPERGRNSPPPVADTGE